MPPWLYLTKLYCTTQKLIIKENVHIRLAFAEDFNMIQQNRAIQSPSTLKFNGSSALT